MAFPGTGGPSRACGADAQAGGGAEAEAETEAETEAEAETETETEDRDRGRDRVNAAGRDHEPPRLAQLHRRQIVALNFTWVWPNTHTSPSISSCLEMRWPLTTVPLRELLSCRMKPSGDITTIAWLVLM
jgi:hypothetical protein